MPQTIDPWTTISVLIEHAGDAIIGESTDGVVVRWNEGAARLLGYSAEEVIGRSASDFLASVSYPGDIRCLAQRLEAREHVRPFEGEMTCSDGSIVAVSIAVSPVFESSGRLIGLAKIVHALGEASSKKIPRADDHRWQLERELAHLARWSAMGQMASVLAHELNQPLTAIVSYLTSARRLLHDGKQTDLSVLDLAMDRANDQASRAAKIIGHLRSFVSPGDAERRPVSVVATIMDAADLALIVARQAGVVVDLQLSEDAVVLGDRVQIQQVIFNLLRNAVEAMAAASSRELRVSTSREDGHIIVSVSDSGPGIPAEVSGRLFQPFVTTKPDGMGVGLSICQSIIKAHGGALWLDDRSSTGATFHFKLPLETDANEG